MVIHSPLLKESECLQSTPYLARSRNKRSSPKILSEVSAVPGSSARFWRLCLCNNHKNQKQGGLVWTQLDPPGAYMCVCVCVCVCACVHVYMCVCVSAQLCLTLQPPGLYPTRLFCPWDFPGKNTAVGCHFPSPGRTLSDPGIQPTSPMIPAWAGGFLTTSATWEARTHVVPLTNGLRIQVSGSWG